MGTTDLVKPILVTIPVFFHSLAYIPKGVLEKIRKKCFKFLLTDKKDNEGIPVVKWKNIAKPKEEGAWVLKNIYFFRKSVATKSLWRVIKHEGLWKQIIMQKYISAGSLMIEL